VSVSAFVRPAGPTTLVSFSDTCEEAWRIPELGGRFEGNTNNASADYSAGCDYGGGSARGAPEQMLRLTLNRKRRFVFDLAGSDYRTLLAIRRGDSCPGEELPNACAPGRAANRSFLDLTLEPGDYFVQVDGFGEASGHWVLDVYSATPE
ncbi:MAG TPA: hypothetical protein VFQ61_25125, partial [Polyangiaceae bacterium]|nr:hypothetical protein [Polyangiaceae bacterium]